MALDHRSANKIQKNLRREDAPGTRVDPYPYIGIVKNNLDPTRSGRLQVWIPDLGGSEDDPNNWRTVSYASPYMGYTSQVQSAADKLNPPKDNTFTKVTHTYGMWAVPPDIGVSVIVIFIAGDPLRGYFIACVNDNLSHFMLPAIAGTPNVDPNSLNDKDRLTYSPGDAVPVVEFNEYIGGDFLNPSYYNNNKPIHETQYNILKQQGLEKDRIRGTISSSSQRETPSHVFGISTPGRPLIDPADDAENYVTQLQNCQIDPKYLTVKTRKGGHVFVMDDGAELGEDQLVRLRTAMGHQFLMHDTDNTIYIGHATGESWVEFTNDGSINVYSKGGVNVRSQGDINLLSDTDINIEAMNNINIKAGSDFALNAGTTKLLQGTFALEATAGSATFKTTAELKVDAGGMISLKSGGIYAVDATGIYQQSGKTTPVDKLDFIQINNLPDVAFSSATDNYVVNQGALDTIVTMAPSHEPFYRGATSVFFQPTSPGIEPAAAYTGAVDATKSAQGTGVTNPPTDKDLRNQPPCDCSIGNLTADELTAYFTTIGKSESGGKYDTVNSIGYVGKYQFGASALVDGGYVKSSVLNVPKGTNPNTALNNPNSWTGKNGINSLQDWLANGAEQESAMCAYTKRNYTSMCKLGAITQDQSNADVAGMLAVSHLLGPGGARDYRNGKNSADAYGTTGATYFNKGQYAVAVLAPQNKAVQQG